jgi:hypothetical protein
MKLIEIKNKGQQKAVALSRTRAHWFFADEQ